MNDLSLFLDIAVALAYALVGGVLARRARLPPLVGYLLAGVAIGPFTPGFVGDQNAIQHLAELGVLFLMFGVGLHFSFGDLWQVRNIAVPGALIQMVVASAIGYAMTRYWGWTVGASLILGVAISVASTVVLLRALMDNAMLDSVHGRVAVGWLVFEDLATVAILVVLPLSVSNGSRGGGAIVAMAIGKAALFIGLMLVVGKRLVPWVLHRVARLESRELFILVALTTAIGTALLSTAWFGVSLALGAFIAGVVVSESPYSHQVGADLLPFREAFAVLFFVSVGMLVNPQYLAQHWREVMALSALIILGKATIAAAVGFLFPYPARTALVVAAGLSQIGEFSFIVGQTGVLLGLLDPAQYSLILAGALVSITVNPFMFRLVDPVERWLSRRDRLWRWLNRHGPLPAAPQHFRDHVVIVGWGRVGRHVADVLGTLGVPRLVIESDPALIEQLTKLEVPTLFGDAANSEILAHADLPHARALVLTIPDEASTAIAVAAARARAPKLHVLARAATREGARQASALGANEVVRPELEGGLQILRRTLLMLGYPIRRIQQYADAIRREEVAPSAASEGSPLLDRLAASALDLDLDLVTIQRLSAVAGLSIADANLRPRSGVSILAVTHAGTLITSPTPDVILHPGDEVTIIGTATQLEAAARLMRDAV